MKQELFSHHFIFIVVNYIEHNLTLNFEGLFYGTRQIDYREVKKLLVEE
jgi:hypothetical protein